MKVYQESKFLKHQDLQGQDWVLTIKEVKREFIKGQDGVEKSKFVVYFNEAPKGLVLNKTNMIMISKLFQSDESDLWIGKRITLYEKDDVEMGGEITSGIRVRSKLPQ